MPNVRTCAVYRDGVGRGEYTVAQETTCTMVEVR
jgi:hypothetical protein